MPEWVSKVKCNKCHKTGHLSFNCPPKYKNQVRKTNKETRQNTYRAKNNAGKQEQSDTAAIAKTEFAGYTTAVNPMNVTKTIRSNPKSHINPNNICSTCSNHRHDHKYSQCHFIHTQRTNQKQPQKLSQIIKRRKRRKLCRQLPNFTNTTNMNRIKFLQQELSYLQKQITKQ